MDTIQNRIFTAVMKLMNMGKLFTAIAEAGSDRVAFDGAVKKIRKMDSSQPPKKLKQVVTRDVDGFGMYTLKGKESQTEKVMLYLHGGAYVSGPSSIHWDFVNRVRNIAEVDVAMFVYPKAPEYQVTETMAVSIKAFEQVADEYGAENMIVMGDSAGAGLALALTMALQQAGKPLPAELILFSPWLDIAMTHPQARPLNDDDLLLDCDGLIVCGDYYRGELAADHPWVSPNYGAINDLPPIQLYVGGREVFGPDCREFYEKVQAAGGQIEFTQEPDLPHVYPLFAMLPEAKTAFDKIIAGL